MILPHTKHSRNNNFTLLRLIFAALVLMSHGNHIFSMGVDSLWFKQAGLAVDGFFIMSGFLIAWSIDNAFSVTSYAIKRLARIYPLYAMVVTAQLLVLWYFNTAPLDIWEVVRYYASNLMTLNFIQPTFGNMVDEPINGSLWIVKIMIMCYAAMPLCVYLLRRFGVYWLVAGFCLSLAWRYGFEEAGLRWVRQMPGSMAFFIAGMAAYFYGPTLCAWLRRPRNFLLLGALLIGLWYLAAGNYYPIWVLYVIGVTAGIYVAAFFVPVMRLGSDISYGVYLWHVPVFLTLRHLEVYADWPLGAFFVGVIIVAILAYASTIMVEMPVGRWARNKARVIESKQHAADRAEL